MGIARKLKQFLRYNKVIEGYVPYFFLEKFFRSEIERMICIEGTNIHVRTNTPDLKVAISSLMEKEYDYIHCENPRFIVDAGANIGTSAIFFAVKYPHARIIAVEPEERNFAMLVKNTINYKNVMLVKAAIWSAAEKRTIQNRFTGHWGYTVADTQNKTEPTGQEIDCITIDALMKRFGIDTIDLLKMDIEGGEKDVLENSAGWIDAVKIITVELHDRICSGCDRAFYLATKHFKRFERHGEKVTAYKDDKDETVL